MYSLLSIKKIDHDIQGRRQHNDMPAGKERRPGENRLAGLVYEFHKIKQS
ncbi:hypothetical protein B0I18_11022 [Taibaiella chishuiensis]|uniref:Uncharacterized protein n=1 Tax=Taibaiella chishuiensis TaxID=1434707 RepID=A0A2P8CXL9_9BACT|nr:hypothetical protein B0I18_11022 [Taibaiella chishuiensis]